MIRSLLAGATASQANQFALAEPQTNCSITRLSKFLKDGCGRYNAIPSARQSDCPVIVMRTSASMERSAE